LKFVRREIGAIGQRFDPDRAEVAAIAALLHDLIRKVTFVSKFGK
jgi:hypothetical protein